MLTSLFAGIVVGIVGTLVIGALYLACDGFTTILAEIINYILGR